ncbi:cytochrome c [Rhizobium sp. EC-SD404]|uniref:SorU family sulfite dehydrogenase c-type cytochrome subunit n=1 Tax=Rhizobium sp. EC-SD404 TaxID=2038389 RepID=UPI00125C32FD|nr:cytochrome c [Rhizobium sp. EC-SD404]VVT25837.1 Cytochrome c, mono-and diheme variants [Rhizobium sp. EC-SD404]
MRSTLLRSGAVLLAVSLLAAAPVALAETDDDKLALGKQVFTELAQPQCGLCHTLADAGTEGGVGPILDDLKPSAEVVARAVENGIGPMRPYTQLTAEEIEAVAFYVASVTGADQ